MTPLQMFTYWLGVVVVTSGGIGVAAVVACWTLNRCLLLYCTATAIVRISRHARAHGLDLRTGKPLCPSCGGLIGANPLAETACTCGTSKPL